MATTTLHSLEHKKHKPDLTILSEYLVHKARYFAGLGRSVFLVDGISDEKRYFKNFDDETRKIASKFYKNGLRKGDIVIYMSKNQIRQILLMTGVWRANGVARSLYSDEAPTTILQKVVESKARWIFCDPVNAESVIEQVVNKCVWPVEVIISTPIGVLSPGCVSFEEYLNDDGIECPAKNVNEDDVALVLPTSGTTGASKGATYSHKSTLAIIKNVSLFPWTFHKCNLIASKATHASGTILPLALLAEGLTGVVLPEVDKEILIKTVDKYKPGFVSGFPTFLLALCSSDSDGFDISSVEIIASSGTVITEEIREKLLSVENVKAVINTYGLTEGLTISTVYNFTKSSRFITYPDCPAASVGRPFPGTLIEIRDIESLEVLSPNQNGEIWTKGEFIFLGYYKNPEATKETLVDGWLKTGDVGYFDNEGFVYFVDRTKDIFKYENNHIYPTELEEVVCMHPSVAEVCVVGVPDEMGEVPRAFVILKETIHPNDKLAIVAEDIKTFANNKLAFYKQLRGGLYIVKDFPKGKSGKVERKLVLNLEIPTYQ